MRRRNHLLIGLLLAAGLLFVLAAGAQEPSPSTPIPPADRILANLNAETPDWEALLSEPLPGRSHQTGRGLVSDHCQTATPITLTLGAFSFSDQVLTTGASITDTDPLQGCTWPSPDINSNSVWWRVWVPADGRLNVRTISENPERYDTVVTIYPASAGCDTLGVDKEQGCDDDTHAFQSDASALVDANESYLVEITEWGPANLGGELDLFVYFTLDSHWQTIPGVGLPIPLTRHTSVSDGAFLYVIGGQSPTLSSNTFRYNPSTQTWATLPPIPQPYSNTDGAYVNGRIYLPAGFAGNIPYEAVHYSYSIISAEWSDHHARITSTAEITEPVAWGAAAADPAENSYYYLGGRQASDPDTPLPFFLQYHIISDTWQTLPPMTIPRYAHRAAFVGDQLCVAGGMGNQGQILASGECYDFASKSWSPTGDLVVPRYSFGSAVGADGRWYVYGGAIESEGLNQLTTPKTEVFDPDTHTWVLLDQRWSLNQSREWPAGALVGMRIYAVGGYLGQETVVVNTMEWLNAGPLSLLFPLVVDGIPPALTNPHEPNDAIPLAFGPLQTGIPIASNFATISDNEDFFFFHSGITGTITLDLTGIPEGANYDLYLYDYSKTLLAASLNLSNQDEHIELDFLPAHAYFVRVKKDLISRPSGDLYALTASFPVPLGSSLAKTR